MTHRVSIIIPCYRQAHYLPEAIDSALGQTYPNVEVIVVNDGSDDDTEAVAANYGDRITYVYKKNGGLSSARNAGIAVATGDYYLFLDSDDLIDENAVSWLVEAAGGQQNRLCMMGWKDFREHPQRHVWGERIPRSEGAPFPELIAHNLAPVHAHLVPRRLVELAGGFEESLRSCEDWDLWIRIGLHSPQFVTVRQCGALYRQTQGSMSSNADRMLKSRAEVLLRLHRAVVDQSDFLLLYGNAMVRSEERVLRRCIAASLCNDLQRRLQFAIRELIRKGVDRPRTLRRRTLDWLVGDRADHIVMWWLRRFRRQTFERYVSTDTRSQVESRGQR